jgi:hypothetical protein
LNNFEAALHLAYLCIKVPATIVVITAFSSQKETKTIERGFTPRHKNVHFLKEDTSQLEQPSSKEEISIEFKKAIEAKGDLIRVELDPIVPDITVCIRVEMSLEEQAELM